MRELTCRYVVEHIVIKDPRNAAYTESAGHQLGKEKCFGQCDGLVL